jgi:photosystem II stability/assembly factor-like uncharacterized protein
MAQGESKPQWESFSDNLFKAKAIGGDKCAIGVDRATGQLFVDVGASVWMSSDQGKTFTRLGLETTGPGPAICARSGWSLWIKPDGGRMAAFNSHVGNKPCSGCSADGGKTWKTIANNWEWGVMGSDNDSILAVGEGVSFSPDAGKTWTVLPDLKRKELAGAGVFGPAELVVSHHDGRVERSVDAGKTWKEVAGNYACVGPLQVVKGVGYWLARKGDAKAKEYCILTSKDKGATWQELCKLDDAFSGVPVFGKSEKDIFVATAKGVMATNDDGATWRLAAGYSDDMKKRGERHIAYDPINDVLYMAAWNWDSSPRYFRLSLKAGTAGAEVGTSQPATSEKGRWVDLTPTCNTQIKSDNKGHLRSVGVDRATGNLFVGDGSIWMSADVGKTFTCVNDEKLASMSFGVGGSGMQTDSAGGKIARLGMSKADGGHEKGGHDSRTWAYSLDGGKSWERCSPTEIAAHGCWGVVSFDSKTILMYGNEGQVSRCSSIDLGKTCSPMVKNKEILGAGIFGDKEWVESNSKTGRRSLDQPGEIERTADGGKTWAKVADYGCHGPMQVVKGVGYWTTKKDEKHWVIITTKDHGKTWQELGKPYEESNYLNSGPIFGKDENHLFVVTWWGILETTDAGANWKMAAPFSGDGPRLEAESLQWRYLVGQGLPSAAYDPVHDTLYLALGSSVWKYQQ